MQLLTLRTKAGWSQEFVARQIEVSRQTIMNWESGENKPNVDKAIKLAKLFGVTVDALLADDDTKLEVQETGQ